MTDTRGTRQRSRLEITIRAEGRNFELIKEYRSTEELAEGLAQASADFARLISPTTMQCHERSTAAGDELQQPGRQCELSEGHQGFHRYPIAQLAETKQK